MRAEIDENKCKGTGVCFTIATLVFERDDFGFASVLRNGEVPAPERAHTIEAAHRCPNGAIVIIAESAGDR